MEYYVFINTVIVQVPFEYWYDQPVYATGEYKSYKMKFYKFSSSSIDAANVFVYEKGTETLGQYFLGVGRNYEEAVELINERERWT